MHQYLRAIGFSKCTQKKDIRALLEYAEKDPTTCLAFEDMSESCLLIEKTFGKGMGIRFYGSYDEYGNLQPEYYFPYAESSLLSSTEKCSIERHTDSLAYSGMIEDNGMGISQIFFVVNAAEYIRKESRSGHSIATKGISLNALSTLGEILLPVYKKEGEYAKTKSSATRRGELLEAARNGDENAMENLALDDMNLYQKVTRRISNEDIYSVIDTSFMPNGLESDLYSVVGEIRDVETITNRLTGENCYRFVVECNNLLLTVTINEMDLLGVPAVGRRFRGDIWLQGTLIYE